MKLEEFSETFTMDSIMIFYAAMGVVAIGFAFFLHVVLTTPRKEQHKTNYGE